MASTEAGRAAKSAAAMKPEIIGNADVKDMGFSGIAHNVSALIGCGTVINLDTPYASPAAATA